MEAMARKRSAKEEDHARVCQEKCGARCCRYITVILPPPKRKADFDEWSWFLAHENIAIYFTGQWHMEVRNKCRYLDDQNRCTIYERRPDVCREYEVESCEFSGDTEHKLHFETKEEFDKWWEAKRRRERARRKKRTKAAKSKRKKTAKRKER